MSKKQHIQFQASADLEAVDIELDAALSGLDEVNRRVEDLLIEVGPVADNASADQSPAEPSGQIEPGIAPNDTESVVQPNV